MKPWSERQPWSSESSTFASTSSCQSRDDQETGSTPMLSSINGDVSIAPKNSFFLFFPPDMDLNPARMVIAEMVGTFVLMFCLCGVAACTLLIKGEVSLLEYAITVGVTKIVVIFCIGPISGSHINPAVSIAYATIGQIPLSKVPIYIFAQTLGSVMGTYTGKLVYGIKSELTTTQPLQGCASAFWVEFLATFILMFLVASLTSEAQSVGKLSGLVVGVAIALLVLITRPLSGGSLNPARSLGPAIVSWNFSNIWIYVIAPVTGAVAGGLLNHFLRLQPPPCTSTPPLKTTLLSPTLIQKTYECT